MDLYTGELPAALACWAPQASSWVCGGWGQTSPTQVRTQATAAPPIPNLGQTRWVFASAATLRLQKPANLLVLSEDCVPGWRQTRRDFSAGLVAAPARDLLVSEWMAPFE